MNLLDREDELARLETLAARGTGGFAVLVGRRRIGKTRILLEWVRRTRGLYSVADESAPEVQRRYLAHAITARFPGFAAVEYPDWASLLARLAAEARAAAWRGPFVIDELPYLVATAPELPSVLQRWLDHEAKAARLVVAVAGSSQRMMQGIVLAESAPLFGRADELLDVQPLGPGYLSEALGLEPGARLVEAYAAWGGVPRYWELAAAVSGDTPARIDRLLLDPLGPLHREPERLLQEESPSALEVRPVLDAIGAGAHRVSEIAGRLARPATSMARPLSRLIGLGLVRRDVPFGESERQTRRALYRIDDPLVRLWFRVVAPHRAALVTGPPAGRRALLARHWPRLVSEAWEDVCRRSLAAAPLGTRLAATGPFGSCRRWWHGNAPEWDLVAESIDGKRLLLGEIKWSARPIDARDVKRALGVVRTRPGPALPDRYAGHELRRALFVPEIAPGIRPPDDVTLVTAAELLA
jgi:AAA+ ATPase superfamily predicted ATPase